MHDCESDEENVIVLSTDEPNDAQIKFRNVKKTYRANQIEQLLKMSDFKGLCCYQKSI